MNGYETSRLNSTKNTHFIQLTPNSEFLINFPEKSVVFFFSFLCANGKPSRIVLREREKKKLIETILVNLQCKYFEWFSSETENWNIPNERNLKFNSRMFETHGWVIFTFRLCCWPFVFTKQMPTLKLVVAKWKTIESWTNWYLNTHTQNAEQYARLSM